MDLQDYQSQDETAHLAVMEEGRRSSVGGLEQGVVVVRFWPVDELDGRLRLTKET